MIEQFENKECRFLIMARCLEMKEELITQTLDFFYNPEKQYNPRTIAEIGTTFYRATFLYKDLAWDIIKHEWIVPALATQRQLAESEA